MPNDICDINNKIKQSMKDYVNGNGSFHEVMMAVKKENSC